jgi:UDP-glucose 4-epimerase
MTSPSSHRVSLVTGGGGFIGSHLVERLLARGERVVVIDDFSTGRRGNLGAAMESGGVRIVEARVSDALPDLDPASFLAIYHLAAAVGVRLVIEQPIRTIETNVLETGAILRFAGRAAVPILIASSSEIYGKSTRIPFAEGDDVVYGPTTLHRWSYACSKAIDEYLALAWHRDGGLPVTIARFFNTVGPRQVGSYGMVLPRFVAAALADRPLEVHGDGRQVRSFCDVRDVAQLLPEMLATPACVGGVFNVGRDEPIEIRALAQLVIDTLGSSSRIEYVPYERAFGPGFDDLRARVPDLTRLRAAVAFAPRIELAQTIRDIAAEMQAGAARAATGTASARGAAS